MAYFAPRYRDGALVPLPLQFFAYKLNFLWPLRDDAGWLLHAANTLALSLSVLCYLATIYAEFTFMSENAGDIPALSECLTTTFMGLQYTVRILLLASQQREMRTLVRRFYRDIYFTAEDDGALYAKVLRITRFADFFTKIYYIPMLLIIVMFLMDALSQGMLSQAKPYFYRMSFGWYDAQAPIAYVLTSLYTGWLNVSCVTLMAGADFMLSLVLCHTSYRYRALRCQLAGLLAESRLEAQRCAGVVADDGEFSNLHRIFRQRLYGVFKQQQQLYSFVSEAKSHFTHQIFYCLSFGVLSLCVVMFQFQRTTIGIGWLKYIVWLISQIAQFILIGHFGQMLMDESSSLQQSFYMCQWEELLASGSAEANKLLMGDIKFAIANAANAIVFDGMKLFPLSHSFVGSALRSAMSYFMFLNTMNDGNKTK